MAQDMGHGSNDLLLHVFFLQMQTFFFLLNVDCAYAGKILNVIICSMFFCASAHFLNYSGQVHVFFNSQFFLLFLICFSPVHILNFLTLPNGFL